MRRLFAFAVVVGLLFASPALAVKELVEVTPQTIPHIEGLSIETKQRDDGTIGFTITRDPSKARWQGRDGHLELLDGSGTAIECYVRGEKKGDKIEYWFAVAPRHVDGAVFELIEIQTAEGDDGTQEKLIGGGTYYRFRLADFAPKTEEATAEDNPTNELPKQ